MSTTGAYYLLIGMMGVNVGLTLAIYGQLKRTNEVHKLLGETMVLLGTTITNMTAALNALGAHVEGLKTVSTQPNDGRVH